VRRDPTNPVDMAKFQKSQAHLAATAAGLSIVAWICFLIFFVIVFAIPISYLIFS
jgi:hypothetical protein